jgi:hypothetical protein
MKTIDAGRATAFFLVLLAAVRASATCGGDCNLDGIVSADEIVLATNVSLQRAGLEACVAADADGDGSVGQADLEAAVRNGLAGCTDELAFVIATDFQTGSFATVTLDEPRQVEKANPQRRVHSDAVARTHGGMVYAVNRFFGDNIQALDPANGFATRWQCSTEPTSNPHDIAFADASKAYVSRNDKPELWIVDPSAPPGCAHFKTGEIDLSSLADADGIPEMDQMAVVGKRLYVVLEYLDRNAIFAPAGRGRIAVIDIETDELVGDIELSGENPFAQTKGLTVRGGKLAVATTGLYGAADGGIELVDLANQTAEGYFISEADLGGDITDFVLVSDHLGYAVLSLADFTNALVAFDPLERRVTKTLLSGGKFIADIELDSRGELFAADRTLNASGLRIFRAADGEALTGLLGTGLPPFDVVFLK